MKQRIISALIALIIIIPIIWVGGKSFIASASILGLIGFYEMIKLKHESRKIPLPIIVISLFSFIYLMLCNLEYISVEFMIHYEAVALIIFLMTIPIIFYNKRKYNIEDAMFLLGVVFFLGVSFNFLITIRMFDLKYLIFLLLITIFTDTFAYITGMLIGKHKMCPSVSPKKTWEGFIGGLVMGTFISTIFYISAFDYTENILILILIIAFLSAIGQLGDLVFSSIKRYYKTKDFGNIMPGHGGVLDRLDSILFVILAFSFIMRLL